MTNIKLSIIIPIYNEEKIIAELYNRLKNAVQLITPHYELVFVNDGSHDNSLEQLKLLLNKDKRVFYINFSRNFGHQVAVSAGLDYVRGDAVVIIDGDLQDPPELIPEMYEKYKDGYEVVYAKRRSRKGETFFKKATAKLFYRYLKNITTIDIPLDTGDFRLIDRKIVDNLNTMPEKNKFLRGQIAWLGYKQTMVLYDRDERKHGTTGYSISKMLKFAIDGITSFSDKPLQYVTRLGLGIALISFGIIIYALISYFYLKQTVSGWTSLIISTMFIGAIQLISIGIIGEYLSRINSNVLNRPLYIVSETNITENNQDSNLITE